jgi:hypothetical protein
MRLFFVAACCAVLSGCAYKAEPIAAPSYNVVTSFSEKIRGKWLLTTEATSLNQTVKSGGQACSAHSFPVELEGAFRTSVSQTLRNVFEQIEDVPTPIAGDKVRARGARGMIVVRGEEVRPRLDVQPGFWTANMRTQVLVVASVYVDGPHGRIFGQSFEGQGTGDSEAGMACEGGAKSLSDSAATATRDTVRKIAEALGNSERIRSTK